MPTVITGDSVTLSGNATSALQAATKQQVDATRIPAGAVLPFAMATAPTGWLECKGQAVSRTTYNLLFLAIGTTYGAGDSSTTFNLPDLRGEFIRGWDNGRGVDSGRALGSPQAAQLTRHSHAVCGDNSGSGPNGQVASVNGSGALGGSGRSGGYLYTNGNGVQIVSYEGGTENGGETRPRSIAMLYCISTGI